MGLKVEKSNSPNFPVGGGAMVTMPGALLHSLFHMQDAGFFYDMTHFVILQNTQIVGIFIVTHTTKQ